MNKKKLVSGITATGSLTLGNYIGAIKNFVKLQDKYKMYIFVADLHALTINIDPETLNKNKKDIMALYIASGLDPSKTILFYQSDVAAHSQASWLIQTQTTLGELSRMIQFKDKVKTKEANGTEKINTSILTYPALMASDILLYNPSIVPTGIDQKQHLELTRNIATRFNNKYGKTFTIPNSYIPKIGEKIMSLTNPNIKMSKSIKNPKSNIFLLENPELAEKKILKAVTDSENNIYISDKKPGIKNLLTIYASLTNNTIEKVAQNFKNVDYGTFKKEVGNTVKNFLINLQNKYKHIISNVDQIAQKGKLQAENVANKQLQIIKTKLGL